MKLFAPGGRKIPDELEHAVEEELRILATGELPTGPAGPGVGVDREVKDPLDEYVAHVVGALEGRRLDGIGVVLDCGNGAAFRSAPKIFKELGADVEVHQRLARRHEHQQGLRLDRHCRAPGGGRREPGACGLRLRRRR